MLNSKQLFKNIMVFLFVLLLITLLDVFSCILNADIIRNNISKSRDSLESAGDYYNLINSTNIYTQIDNWTEGTFLEILYSVDNTHPIISAFGNKSYNEKTGIERIVSDIDGNISLNDKVYRPAYWLGYRLWAAFLLRFFSYDTALMINIVIKLGITAIAFALLIKKNIQVAVILFISLFLSNAYVCYFKFTGGSECILITLIMVLCLLYCKDGKVSAFCVFMVGGMLTCFLDWFTIPLLSLGLPLIVYISCLNYKLPKKNILRQFVYLVIGWGIGYGGTMLARQVMAYITLGNEAINYFMNRLSDDSGINQQAILKVIDEMYKTVKGCFSLCNPFRYIILHFGQTVFFICLMIFTILWTFMTIVLRSRICVVIYWFIGIMPVIWFSFFHSLYINHAHIGYKVLAVTFASVIKIFIEFVKTKNLNILNVLKR